MSETTPNLESAEDIDARFDMGTVHPECDADSLSPEEAVEYVLADCSFAVGQTVGMRTTVDYDAIVWWHNHFRTKFLTAIRRQGNRWLQDRQNVTAVGWMLGERAIRHADGRDSINVDAARRAAADVERYCETRSKRTARSTDRDAEANPRLAGYWCIRW